MESPARTQKELTLETFTSGQVARICRVAPRTVSKWIDSKQLRGHRLPSAVPGVPGDRRVPRANLVTFMAAVEMPCEWLREFERAELPAAA